MSDFFLKRLLLPGGIVVLLLVSGCIRNAATNGATTNAENRSNRESGANSALKIGDLEFQLRDGEGYKTIQLNSLLGKRNVLMVVTRGFFGEVCPVCTSQTTSLAEQYSRFQDLDTDVVVVFPIDDPKDIDRWRDLETRVIQDLQISKMLPFPILVDMDLAAVDRLGIRGTLALPSTYLIDTEGRVRFSYVGTDPADRPSTEMMLEQIRGL